MKYITWILGFLFYFPLVKMRSIELRKDSLLRIHFKSNSLSKEGMRRQILKKSRNLRHIMRDIERKERKMTQIKEDLVPLIAKYRKM